MNEMAYVFQAWLPLVVWQQVDAPQYRKGFITVTIMSVILIISTVVTWRLQVWEGKRYVYLRILFLLSICVWVDSLLMSGFSRPKVVQAEGVDGGRSESEGDDSSRDDGRVEGVVDGGQVRKV